MLYNISNTLNKISKYSKSHDKKIFPRIHMTCILLEQITYDKKVSALDSL